MCKLNWVRLLDFVESFAGFSIHIILLQFIHMVQCVNVLNSQLCNFYFS